MRSGRRRDLRQITVPLAVPGLISAGIFSFTLSWNEFICALAFIQSVAGSLLSSLPVAILYSFFVDYYVLSLSGAVKE